MPLYYIRLTWNNNSLAALETKEIRDPYIVDVLKSKQIENKEVKSSGKDIYFVEYNLSKPLRNFRGLFVLIKYCLFLQYNM